MIGRIGRAGVRAFGTAVLFGCAKLEGDDAPLMVNLSASVERTVNDQNPRVYACTVLLNVTASRGGLDSFVELVALRRTIELEGQESTSTDPAAPKLGTRRLYAGNETSGTDSFSATFPFKANFSYTLHYRDTNLRMDSTRTTTTCG